MPSKLVKCMESWRKYLPDYELVRWDLKKFPLEKNVWVKQAFENKKYAFAADYIRLYALATEGGIYLDSDVEVLKSFDDLLDKPYFICKENSPQGLEAAIIGSEKGCGWVKKCLDYYDGKEFIGKDGKLSTKVLPVILLQTLNDNFNVIYIDNSDKIKYSDTEVYILPSDYFSPKNYVTKKIKVTSRTYAIHHFAGSWQPRWKKILLRLWVPFKVCFPKLASKIKSV